MWWDGGILCSLLRIGLCLVFSYVHTERAAGTDCLAANGNKTHLPRRGTFETALLPNQVDWAVVLLSVLARFLWVVKIAR